MSSLAVNGTRGSAQNEKTELAQEKGRELYQKIQAYVEKNWWIRLDWEDMSDEKEIIQCRAELVAATNKDEAKVADFVKFVVEEVKKQSAAKAAISYLNSIPEKQEVWKTLGSNPKEITSLKQAEEAFEQADKRIREYIEEYFGVRRLVAALDCSDLSLPLCDNSSLI